MYKYCPLDYLHNYLLKFRTHIQGDDLENREKVNFSLNFHTFSYDG